MKFIFKNKNDFFYIDYLVNPIPAFFIFLIALNDHYLKYQFKGFLTGKISDFCGMFYFPLLLCASYTLIANLFSRLIGGKYKKIYINKTMVLFALGLSGSLMIALKINFKFNVIMVLFLNKFGFQNQIIMDTTDLVSLFMLPLSYWYASHFFIVPLRKNSVFMSEI
jgi:hypothetical protein